MVPNMKNLIDVELARKTFAYNKEAGELSKISGRAPRNGKIGGIKRSGTEKSARHYLRLKLGGKFVYAHRLIWVIVTGEQPEDIDHIDGNGLNNKWNNLRSVSHSMNGRNQKLPSNNKSGIAGIFQRKENGRWRAKITVEGKVINLGTFKDKNDAIEARKQAEIEHGFTQLTKE